MGKPERNEPSRSLTAPTLRRLCADIIEKPLMRVTPGGRELTELLGLLRLWVGETEQRLEALEQAVESGSRPLPRKLREQLYGLLSIAEREGQIERPIVDRARPGGPTDEEWRRAMHDLAVFNSMSEPPCECELAGPVNPACPHHGSYGGTD